jgi:hypothetical protein
MRTTIRIGLRTISVATIAIGGWLAAAILAGRASRGQDLVALWATVSAGCVALVWTTVVATRPATRPWSSSRRWVVALAILGVAALAFGLFVLGSELTRAVAGEGYLFGIGLILTVHGLLAAAWTGVSVLDVVA